MEVKPRPATTTRKAAGGAEGVRQENLAVGPAGAGGGVGRKGDPISGGLKDRDPRSWSEVLWKSVCLARQERDRGGRNNKNKREPTIQLGAEQEEVALNVQHSGIRNDAGGVDGGGGAREGMSRTLQETEASSMTQHARRREDEFLAGGAQNYYSLVRVCGSCFRVSGPCS